MKFGKNRGTYYNKSHVQDPQVILWDIIFFLDIIRCRFLEQKYKNHVFYMDKNSGISRLYHEMYSNIYHPDGDVC